MPKNKYGRPKARRLNQVKVEEFLTRISFETESIHQEWRHLHAFGIYGGKPSVFKLATTQATGQRTQNEYRWNQLVHAVPVSQRLHMTVPENYSSGFFGKLFYFIAERFMSNPLASKDEDLSNQTLPIKLIAQMTREIQTLNPPKEYLEERRKTDPEFDRPRPPVQEKLMEAAAEWASQVPINMEPYLEVIRYARDLKRSPAHGDFVIRQLYPISENVLGVIDGEHAGISGPKYYDVAQFYIRLRNDHNASEQAKQYLLEFKKLLPEEEKANFWNELKPILTERFIGDLWGAKNNPEKLNKLDALGREILNDQILS